MKPLTIKVRTRTAKESVTLGFIVARRYFWPLLLAGLPAWIVVTALAVAICGWHFESPMWALVAVWWFKPLYERPMIARLSRLVFAEQGTRREWLSAPFAQGWLAEITLLRLAVSSRGVRHAVNLLEGVDGAQRRQRIRDCSYSMRGGAGSAGLMLSLVETLFALTIILFLPNLPEIRLAEFYNDPQGFAAYIAWFVWLLAGLLMFASLLGSLYFSAVGFMLYLNGRIRTEGWAIALDLQAMAARLLTGVCVIVLSGLLMLSSPAKTMDAAQVQTDRMTVNRLIADRKIGPFHEVNQRVKKADAPNQDAPGQQDSFNWNMGGASNAGSLAKGLLLFVLVGLVVWLVLRLLGYSRALPKPALSKKYDKDAALIRHLEKGEFSADSIEQALVYWRAGEAHAALNVLYQRIVRLPARHGLEPVATGESEYHYLARSRKSVALTHYQFLQELFLLWQRGTYGHYTPSSERVYQLIERYRALWS